LAFTPELVQSIGLVRQARRLRGISTKGPRGLRGIAVPVLESALDRSLQLATSMDARGYGRRNPTVSRTRRLAAGATVGGMLLAALGLYGILDSGSLFGLGLPVFAVAVVLCASGLALGGRRTTRSRYRPDPWRRPEWMVAGSGVTALILLVVAHASHVGGLSPSFTSATLAVPPLPLLPVLGILLALLPAVIAPAPTAGPIARTEPPMAETDIAETHDLHGAPA
jgi:energy-coupling factor transport system permease protein